MFFLELITFTAFFKHVASMLLIRLSDRNECFFIAARDFNLNFFLVTLEARKVSHRWVSKCLGEILGVKSE